MTECVRRPGGRHAGVRERALSRRGLCGKEIKEWGEPSAISNRSAPFVGVSVALPWPMSRTSLAWMLPSKISVLSRMYVPSAISSATGSPLTAWL